VALHKISVLIALFAIPEGICNGIDVRDTLQYTNSFPSPGETISIYIGATHQRRISFLIYILVILLQEHSSRDYIIITEVSRHHDDVEYARTRCSSVIMKIACTPTTTSVRETFRCLYCCRLNIDAVRRARGSLDIFVWSVVVGATHFDDGLPYSIL